MLSNDKIRRVLFTHIDLQLDGAGSELIVKLIYPDIETYRVDYNFDSDLTYRKIMAEADSIIFTDISVSRNTAEALEATRNYGKELLLLDHHESARNSLEDLNYPWIHIDIDYSGALLAFLWYKDRLSMTLDLASYSNYGYIAQLVSDYDLWHHRYPESKKLQFLWSKIGTEQFINRFLQNSSMIMSEEEESLIKESMDALEESYQIANANMESEDDAYGNKWLLIKNIGAMYSLVADRILKENPDAAYCCIMNRKGSLSFRSQYYNVEQIAKALGGGGHKLASGCSLPNGLIDIVSSVSQRKWVTYSFKQKLLQEI